MLNLYYKLKPFFPQRLRMAVRRGFARRKLKIYKNVWPINESTAQPPADWPGWPDKKKFAVVLTHDVERQRGVDRVRQLAELEMEFGFRSSFNFIPEGEYEVPKELRDWLTGNGFEVGVHDLHHDGKLYTSYEGFNKKAKRINQYAKEWGAVGFRSGFMLHNLDWIRELDIAYDASTFDTDPFEPQPDAANTIFPFWVPGSGDSKASGYIELPYTLPQDSTMFLLFKEKTADIWKKKLDWIADKGGMALLNVHPDYIQFRGSRMTATTFSYERYAEFLSYVVEKYKEICWKPLPKEVAYYYKRKISSNSKISEISHTKPQVKSRVIPSLAGKRAAVFLFSYYPEDPRPRRAAEAMAMAGMEVDLFCLKKNEQSPVKENIKGVNVRRISIKKKRESKLSYVKQYVAFFIACAFHSTIRSFRNSYDIVHTHNMPDFLVFSSLVPKIFGAKCILDLHDPMPELMMGIYGLKEESFFVRFMKFIERVSIGFADIAITPNITFKRLFIARSCREEKMQIVMNTPEQRIFDPDRYVNEQKKEVAGFKIMHHGSIVHRHGVDLLVEAIAKVKKVIPEASLEIYGGRTDFLDTVLETASRCGIEDFVNYHGDMSQEEIAAEIRRCSLGIVPNRRSSFTEINFPTRLFEYLCMDRPVIAPSTKGIKDYFDESQMLYFNPNDVDDLVERILWVYRNPGKVEAIVAEGKKVYRQHLWKEERIDFLNAVSGLLS